jgi:chaperone modulatory protein CbpM
MTRTSLSILHCQVVEEEVELSLAELCRACDADSELVVQLVEQGLIEPRGSAPPAWVFAGTSLRRTRVAVRLMRDLELNLPGAALAVDLLDEIARLQQDLQAASGARPAA